VGLARFFNSLLLILLTAIQYSVSAETLAGRVVRITDGDTITILDSSKTQHKIRLQGIDTLERKQSFGNRYSCFDRSQKSEWR
jgi:endonuclease YncB( thermonuclease family)